MPGRVIPCLTVLFTKSTRGPRLRACVGSCFVHAGLGQDSARPTTIFTWMDSTPSIFLNYSTNPLVKLFKIRHCMHSEYFFIKFI